MLDRACCFTGIDSRADGPLLYLSRTHGLTGWQRRAVERKSEEKQAAARDARSRETRGGRPLRNSIQSSAEVHQASSYSARLKASCYRRVSHMPPGIHCIAISKIDCEYSRFRVTGIVFQRFVSCFCSDLPSSWSSNKEETDYFSRARDLNIAFPFLRGIKSFALL